MPPGTKLRSHDSEFLDSQTYGQIGLLERGIKFQRDNTGGIPVIELLEKQLVTPRKAVCEPPQEHVQ